MTVNNYPDSLKIPVFEAFCKSVDKQYIYICDVKTNIWRWSPYAVDYFGLPDELVENLPAFWLNKVHPDDREMLAGVFSELFEGKTREHCCEYRVKNASDDYIWVLCRGCMAYDESGNMDICAGIITHLGQHNKFDAGTGLLSIHEFRRVLSQNSGQEIRGGILLIGIDSFRRMNETRNYSFGNILLREYASKLLELTSNFATAFRMDGDKFAFICEKAEETDLKDLFDKILRTAQTGMWIEGEHISFSVTGGAVLYPENGITADGLYTNLEYALESAKKNNREGLTYYTEHLQRETMERFHFHQKLKESIENDFKGFYLCYQPTVAADQEHTFIGAEALLRWFHPEFGFVSPIRFIPVLEESGKIISVDRWVFSTAINQVKEWLSFKPDMKISINVSLIQFMDEGFRQFVLDEIDKIDFPKKQLILELTESCNVQHPDKIREEFDFFRRHGIQIALDDFGTGYASLSILRDLTADWIKVDHSFVAQIAHNDYDQALTESVINLCKRLNLNVCVEGIETEEIENVIQQYQPTSLQGYLFSKPLDAKQFEKKYIMKY